MPDYGRELEFGVSVESPKVDSPGWEIYAGEITFPDDRLERIDGEWKFVHRTLLLDQSVPEQGGSRCSLPKTPR